MANPIAKAVNTVTTLREKVHTREGREAYNRRDKMHQTEIDDWYFGNVEYDDAAGDVPKTYVVF